MSEKYDIVQIKDRLPALSELLTRDGYEIERSGSALFVCCPFHDEKSPSCRVDDDRGRYHCFGCGADGDIIDYWQKANSLSIQETLAQLAVVAGVLPGSYTPSAPRKPAAAKAEAKVEPMTGDALARWHEACKRLAGSQREIQRIADWRGIDPACVEWAARQGLMGTYLWWDLPREAFLVEMPDESGARVPVSVHIRLAAGSKGNPRQDKQIWNFNPKGSGAWPFIVGKPATAAFIFLVEGQWDALALISMMGWHLRDWPRRLCVIGLRGSTSGAKMLQHTIHPKATVFAIADADGAGAGWFENKGDIKIINGNETEVREDGILAKLHTRVHAVHGFWPTTAKHDLNDLIKAGEIDRETMLAHIQPLIPDPRQQKRGPTFAAWCKMKQGEPDPIGHAARFITDDKGKPKGRRPLRDWDRHWRKLQTPENLYVDLCLTFAAYQKDCKSLTHSHESDPLLIAS